VVIFELSVPAGISAFSTSGMTLKPAIGCVGVGGALMLLASSQATEGYSLTELPRIVMRLLN
jgi:hypothetical protein